MCFNLSSYFHVENLNFDFTYVKEIFASKEKLLRAIINYTVHIFIKICGLNGFPRILLRPTVLTFYRRKRKKKGKNFHHRNLHAEKKKKDHSCFCQRLNCN